MTNGQAQGDGSAMPSRCERCNARRKLVQVGIFEPQWVCWACATGRNAYAGSQPVTAPDDTPRACTNCGEHFPLYGDRYLCWLCQDIAGNQGIPDLTIYSAATGEQS